MGEAMKPIFESGEESWKLHMTRPGVWIDMMPDVGDMVRNLTKGFDEEVIGLDTTNAFIPIKLAESGWVDVEEVAALTLRAGDQGRVNKARPGWMNDGRLEEMRRLKGSSEEEPSGDTREIVDLWAADKRDGDGRWADAKPGHVSWLTPAGHAALAAIEAEEPKSHGNCIDGECERCNEAEPWTPKYRETIRVKHGERKGDHGVFHRLISDNPAIAWVSFLGEERRAPVDMDSLEPVSTEDFRAYSAFRNRAILRGMAKPVLAPAKPTGTHPHPGPLNITASLPQTQESVAEQIRKAVMSAVLSNPGQVPDEVNIKFTLPGSIRNVVVGDMGNGRADGHDTGPILTGNARESYLAIQSGAEDPHAAPETVTEPSCGYCKDTGIGELGMDCPVRTCEAVAT